MADGITVRIVGPDLALLATMVNAKIVKAAEEDLDTIASLIQQDAKDNCPVATGALRDDIQVYADGGKRDIGNMNIPYSIFVHNGTWKMRARPYLFNASEMNKNKWVSVILAHPGI